ncbi:MAG: hypothetical protein K0M47_27435, partial [Rhizobium sp.]|nr:hypothetical protein [Rhizobium sp.]
KYPIFCLKGIKTEKQKFVKEKPQDHTHRLSAADLIILVFGAMLCGVFAFVVLLWGVGGGAWPPRAGDHPERL